MNHQKKICVFILCFMLVCLAGLLSVRVCMYLPKRYDTIQPVRELGLFQDLQIEDGHCVYEIPPSVRSWLQPFLRPMQSWHGEIYLLQDAASVLLQEYEWIDWHISDKEWLDGMNGAGQIAYSDRFMFEFDSLESKFINNNFLICETFDQQQDQTHRIGQLHSYFDPDKKIILFYYFAA